MKRFLLIPYFWIFILIFPVLTLQAEETLVKKKKKEKAKTTKKIVEPRDPHKATLWALLPGGGQIYNRKYWKLSIVYTGFAVTTYFIISNRNEYIKYNDAYICSAKEDDSDGDFTCEDPLANKYSTSDLQTIRDYYRRNLELSFIATAAWYVLQMLDATVDAHLTHWNINEDLRVDVEPVLNTIVPNYNLPMNQPGYNGVRITMRF